jgi:predicted O-linked N-acetylglucosamine transferase (SPINDLY family)
MDYLLADPVSVPESDRWHFTETIWYLPETINCLTPPKADPRLSVTPAPALNNGYITFGSFQNLPKINDAVLTVWGKILRALPEARLRLQIRQITPKNDTERAHLLQRLNNAGIAPERVRLGGLISSREDYLATHGEVDIILDTFPCPGITTTCEALWMGVPTLTLAGNNMLARQGASLLNNVGLTDWVSNDVDDYITRALQHASDVEKLVQLRSGLRERVRVSPLFDAPRFAAYLQTALQDMWNLRLAKHPETLQQRI